MKYAKLKPSTKCGFFKALDKAGSRSAPRRFTGVVHQSSILCRRCWRSRKNRYKLEFEAAKKKNKKGDSLKKKEKSGVKNKETDSWEKDWENGKGKMKTRAEKAILADQLSRPGPTAIRIRMQSR